MTTEAACLPLITRFAAKIVRDRDAVFRYDTFRQISQVWNGKEWVDAVDARVPLAPETLMTKVHQETTDDS